MPSLIERIATELMIPESLIVDALNLAHTRFKKIEVRKRSGAKRTIVQPASELKVVQEWLAKNILSPMPISQLATAFRKGASILKNAYLHRESLYSVRIDLANFFNSIEYRDLQRVLISSSKIDLSLLSTIDFDRVLSRACFDKHLRLPIGYITSPLISNIVMCELDRELEKMVQIDTDQFGHAVLTRYADDFVFSTNKKGACAQFVKSFIMLLDKTETPRLKLNADKTRFMSLNGGSTLVTGLRITQQNNIRVHANYRDHVRLLLKLYSSDKLKPEEHESLRGHLSFVEHTDPSLFTKLSFRYYSEISRLRGKG